MSPHAPTSPPRYALASILPGITGHSAGDLAASLRTSGIVLPTVRVCPGTRGPGLGARAHEVEAVIAWLSTHLGTWSALMEARIRDEAQPLAALNRAAAARVVEAA